MLFVSGEISHKAACGLSALDGRVVLLPPWERLSAPCASHADLLLAPFGDGLLLHREYYKINRRLFDGVNVILTDEPMGAAYPSDILFDALVIGDAVYGKTEYISEYIKAGRRTVPVKQGYTRCSTLALPHRRAAITADRGIAEKLEADGINVLKISLGGISLPGMSWGFIGGASGVVGDCVVFFGDLDAHPDGAAIRRFLSLHGMKAVLLDTAPLTDFGGTVLI